MISTKSQVLPEDQTSHATTSDQLMAIDPILGSKGGHGGTFLQMLAAIPGEIRLYQKLPLKTLGVAKIGLRLFPTHFTCFIVGVVAGT